MVTPSDIQVLLLLATYFTLTRAQIGRLAFPDDRDGRATRRHLQKLLNQRLVQRTRMEVVNPAMGAPAPVYYLTGDGAGFLAQQLQDEKYLSCCTQAPNWQHLYHWCAVAEFHIELDRAVVQSADVRVSHWFGEWDVLDPAAREPERHFRLYTRLSDKLVCVPDAAFELERVSGRRAFYLELDRHTTMNAERVAAQKCGGYAGLLAERQRAEPGHLRHFPESNPARFTVLMVAPSTSRRDALRRAIATKSGSALWRFASQTDLNSETMLRGPIWHPCIGEPAAILKD